MLVLTATFDRVDVVVMVLAVVVVTTVLVASGLDAAGGGGGGGTTDVDAVGTLSTFLTGFFSGVSMPSSVEYPSSASVMLTVKD